MFTKRHHQTLKFYVYLLVDSCDGEIFYVGTGKGNKVFDHINLVARDLAETDQVARIRQIQDLDGVVIPLILRFGLTESEAVLVSTAVNDLPLMDIFHKESPRNNNSPQTLRSIDEVLEILNAGEPF